MEQPTATVVLPATVVAAAIVVVPPSTVVAPPAAVVAPPVAVVAPAIVVAPATRLERIKTIGVKTVHFIIWDTSGRDGKEGGSDNDSRMSQAVQDTDHCSLWSTERVLWWWCASHLRKRRMVFLAERARCPSYFLLCH